MTQSDFTATLKCGTGRLPSIRRQIVCLALGVWILVVLVLGSRLAYQSVIQTLSALTGPASTNRADLPGSGILPESPVTFAAAALLTYLAVFLSILATRRIRPSLTLALSFLGPAVIYFLAVLTSGAIPSALAACVLVAGAWMAGDLLLRVLRIPIARVPLAAGTSLRVALGFGCISTATLLLGSVNSIAFVPVSLLLLTISATWAWQHRRALTGIPRSNSSIKELAASVSWFETLLLASSAALVTFAALASLTPESILTGSDSVRQHLPQAREIWQDHAVLVYPTIETPSASVLGASLNAVAYGLGGFTAVRILQTIASVCCLLAIAGLGATLCNRLAGIAAAACFSTIPLVLWLTGHAYPDVFAVLFICVSVQCAILWQQEGRGKWLLISGMAAGFCLATKQISAVYVIAIVIALAITARPGVSLVERCQAITLFATAGVLATVPWLVRSAILTGTFPLIDTITRQLANVPGPGVLNNSLSKLPVSVEPTGSTEVFPGGVTRSFAGLIAGPWDLTFKGPVSNFRVVRYGEFGILLLMLLPLIASKLRSRSLIFIAITALISYVGWVFTIQVPRHLLPSLALLSVLAGVSIAHVADYRGNSARNLFGQSVKTATLVGVAMTPLFLLPNVTTSFPVSVIVGATSEDAYLARVDPATAALRAATALLPPDTRVGYIGQWQGAQSETEARLVYLGQFSANGNDSLDTQIGDTPETILANLDQLGIQYLIWDRPDTRPQDIESTLLSGDFLLKYTRVLGGDDGVYLFALDPDGVESPTSRDNLLQDPGFATLRKPENVWNGTKRDVSDAGGLRPRRQVPVTQRVAVTPATPFLIVLTGACTSVADYTRVTLTWLDAKEEIIDVTTDFIASGTKSNSTLMWRVSPENAEAADLSITTAAGSPCQISSIGMYRADSPK
jgi:hypothetical protein